MILIPILMEKGIWLGPYKVELKPEEITEAASTSLEYLEGIREARSDYKDGRIKGHKEVFGL